MGKTPGHGPYPPGQGPGNQTTFVGGEFDLFGGFGLTSVTCQDECDNFQTFRYLKVCGGLAAGGSANAGFVSNMSGKSCRSDTYKGWFKEYGASIGFLGGGADFGYNSDGLFGLLPGSESGVNEGGMGFGFGASLKFSWCYYLPLQ
jgi:hypothetical protein